MPSEAGFRWVSAEAGRRHQGGCWWHRGEDPTESGLQPGLQCRRRRAEVIRGTWGKYNLRQPPPSKQGRIWSLWASSNQTLEVKQAGGSFPVWTRGVPRCVSQACKKTNEPVFKVKFIREEKSRADSFLKHPPPSFPTYSPTVGARERMGAGLGAPGTKSLLGLLKHPGEKLHWTHLRVILFQRKHLSWGCSTGLGCF